MCTEDVNHHKHQGEGKGSISDPEEESEDVEGRGDAGEGLVGTVAMLPGTQGLRMSICTIRRAARLRIESCCQ